MSYAAQIRKLFPRGRLWRFEPDSNLWKLVQAIADEFDRVRGRGKDLINESDPRTATETIADWEAMLSLPDERVPELSAVLAERRVAVTSKFVAQGGSNYAYYETLTLACGYPLVSIEKLSGRLLRAGFRVGDRAYSDAYAYAILITVDEPPGAALSHADFERAIRHVTHAHIEVMFTYL